MHQRLRVFVGSASESLHVAEAFQTVVSSADIEVSLWPEVFNVGEYPLDDLRDAAREHDFAVFVFSPDDETTSHNETQMAPRDNVVFELGMFSSALGPRRTFVLKAEGPSVKVPSDLAGVGYAAYTPPSAAPLAARWESAVRTGARKIRRAIDRAQAVEVTSGAEEGAPAGPGDDSAPVLSPIELVAGDLTSAARHGILPQVAGLVQGLLVVHAVHGVGQVVGFDPPGTPDRTARVRFVTGLGLMQVEELHLAAPDIRLPPPGD